MTEPIANAKWRGSTALKQTPRSGTIRTDNGKVLIELEYRGPYASCVQYRPSVGMAWANYGGFYVVASNVARSRGPAGLLGITLESVSEGSIGITPTRPKLEITWEPVEIPIERHPKFRNLAWDDAYVSIPALVRQYFAEGDATRQKAVYKQIKDLAGATINPTTDDLAGRAARALYLISEKNRGVDSYQDFYPVITRTREFTTAPLRATAGLVYRTVTEINILKSYLGLSVLPRYSVTSLGGTANLRDYQWRATGDSGTRTGRYGRWECNEKWTGCEEVDGVLYPITADWPTPLPNLLTGALPAP